MIFFPTFKRNNILGCGKIKPFASINTHRFSPRICSCNKFQFNFWLWSTFKLTVNFCLGARREREKQGERAKKQEDENRIKTRKIKLFELKKLQRFVVNFHVLSLVLDIVLLSILSLCSLYIYCSFTAAHTMTVNGIHWLNAIYWQIKWNFQANSTVDQLSLLIFTNF